VVGLLDWELWAQAGHVAFAYQALVAVDGEDVARKGWEFHGQMGGGYHSAEGVKGRTTRRTL